MINNVDWQGFKDGGDKKAIEELRPKVENGSPRSVRLAEE
jgi:hypothetical protein